MRQGTSIFPEIQGVTTMTRILIMDDDCAIKLELMEMLSAVFARMEDPNTFRLHWD